MIKITNIPNLSRCGVTKHIFNSGWALNKTTEPKLKNNLWAHFQGRSFGVVAVQGNPLLCCKIMVDKVAYPLLNPMSMDAAMELIWNQVFQPPSDKPVSVPPPVEEVNQNGPCMSQDAPPAQSALPVEIVPPEEVKAQEEPVQAPQEEVPTPAPTQLVMPEIIPAVEVAAEVSPKVEEEAENPLTGKGIQNPCIAIITPPVEEVGLSPLLVVEKKRNLIVRRVWEGTRAIQVFLQHLPKRQDYRLKIDAGWWPHIRPLDESTKKALSHKTKCYQRKKKRARRPVEPVLVQI